MAPSPERATRLGQVLESSTRGFVAQAQELHRPPALGALVRAEGPSGSAIYGVVTGSKTESVEGRLPVATGWGLADGAAVLREEPHLEKLLRTSFEACIVAFDPSTPLRTGSGGGLSVGLPPAPAVIYGFVQEADGAARQALATSLDFLPLLLAATAPGLAEEAASACLRLLSAGQTDAAAFRVRAGKRLAVLLAHEPVRLESALRGLAQ